MKKNKKNLLTEIHRIHQLLGTKLISEGVIDDIVRVILRDAGSYSDTLARERIENALNLATSQGRSVNINSIADDLWKLIGNNSDLVAKVTDEILKARPQLRSQMDTILANPTWKNQEISNIPTLVNNIVDKAFQNSALPVSDGYKSFLKKRLTDEVTESVTTALSKEQKEIVKNLVKTNETVWDKIFIDGQKVADQVKKDLDALATVKFVDEADSVTIQKRVQENLKKLIDWRRSTYNNLVNELNAIAKGTTNRQNAFRYTNLIESIKKEYGDWALLNDISKNKPLWKKVIDVIGDALYNGTKLELNVLAFPFRVLGGKLVTKEWVQTLLNTTVQQTSKQASKDTAMKSFTNWLTVYTPRGLPNETNIKNYQDIYNVAGKWGMTTSYGIEVLTRAYKLAFYIVLLRNLYEALIAGTNRIDESPQKSECNKSFINIIKQKSLGPEEASEFLISQFKPGITPELPCILKLNMSDVELSEFLSVAVYRAKGTEFWSWLGRIANEAFLRIRESPQVGGPPFISIPALFYDFSQKSVWAVIAENMPEIDTSQIRGTTQNGSNSNNGRVGPTPRTTSVPSPTTTTETPTLGRNQGN
jgi:hypothetical protein